MNTVSSQNDSLFASIREILASARQTAYKAVNFAMVTAYWNIGRLIVEDEQNGNTRAEYGKAVLEELSTKLTEEFGKGFGVRELRKIRQFYLEFPKGDALRPELTWSHYRLLIRVQDEQTRLWYMNEAAEQAWSSRQLDRQISVLYYERLLNSADKNSVRTEAIDKMATLTPQCFIHDPYVLDFLNLKDYPALHESTIEQGLIDNLQAFLLELGKGFCFVVDTIGVLSSLYRYGRVAYVGGGFGVGIHNTLEAAVWQIPVVFGPNYAKFREANDLIACGGGFCVRSYRHLEYCITALLIDHDAGQRAGEYVRKHVGATEKISKEIFS